MRLLFLTYEFPPLGGGAGNAAAELVRALADRADVEIVVVTSSMDEYEVAEGSFTPNSTIHRLPVGKTKGNIHFQTNAELLRYFWSCHRFLERLLAKQSFDHCHAHMTVPAGVNAWCFRRKVPYLVSLQGSDVPGYSARFKSLYALLTPIIHRVWKDAAHVVSNSAGLRELALESAPGQRVEVIPNGIDSDLFSPGREPAPANGKLRVICVGRLIERKGVWELAQGNGLIVPKKSPGALARAILEILSDDRKRREMRAASLRLAATFSWKTMARKYLELYA